ncbi:MAG TPA: CsbD family protein [Gemmatimonadales bacterium]
MKASTRNQTKGILRRMKGGLKEGVGDLIDDPELEAEGKVEKVAGKVQEEFGKVEKHLGK